MSSSLLYAQLSKFIVVKLLLSESQVVGGGHAAFPAFTQCAVVISSDCALVRFSYLRK